MSDCTMAVDIYQSGQNLQSRCIQLRFVGYFICLSHNSAVLYIQICDFITAIFLKNFSILYNHLIFAPFLAEVNY